MYTHHAWIKYEEYKELKYPIVHEEKLTISASMTDNSQKSTLLHYLE